MAVLNFVNQVSRTARIPRAVIREAFKRTLGHLGKRPSGQIVSVVFVSPAVSTRLNKTYRGTNSPANVLSFASLDKQELGDIIICPIVARKEAHCLKLPLSDWIARLFIHGLLHLLGFDHRTSRQSTKMKRIEEAIIYEFGEKI